MRLRNLCAVFITALSALPLLRAVEPTDFTAVLAVDQADNRVRLISIEEPMNDLWSFPKREQNGDKFRPTDAKKVLYQGATCILAAYHGRVRMIRFRDQKILIDYPTPSSCHSAELLPGGLIVTANSNHGILRLHINEEHYFDVKMPTAHGVVWDRARHCLWALGDELYRLKLADEKLLIQEKYPLPHSPSGHDLFPLIKEDKLLVSDNGGLYLFSIDEQKFDTLTEIKHIKSASQNSDGSIWATVPKHIKGAENWQTDDFARLTDGKFDKTYHFPQARFYKARWWQEVKFSRLKDPSEK